MNLYWFYYELKRKYANALRRYLTIHELSNEPRAVKSFRKLLNKNEEIVTGSDIERSGRTK